MSPWRRPEVLRDADPFVKHTPQQVERTQLPHNTVTNFFAFDFFSERPEHAVPDDEGPRKIAVEITRVGCMMHAVMAWAIHDIFEPAREFADGFGVDPELVNEIEGADK